MLTKTQDQQLGSAIDSEWYGMGPFVDSIRDALAGLTLDGVNAAIRRHLSAENLHAVFITKDAAGLRDELLADEFSAIDYAGVAKPEELLAEDQVIGSRKLNLSPERVVITPIEDVFA